MKFRNILLVSAAVFSYAASISASTIAHTFVSRIGADTNPCTSSGPCATFTGALAKTASGGLISVEDVGDFGPVSINQSVTIDGSNLGSITFSGSTSNGITIFGGANVTVQNLTINGLGTGAVGIYVPYGGIVTVDNCKIMNVIYNGIDFFGPGSLAVENSRIESFIGGDAVYGIEMGSNAEENVVVRNTVIDASPVSNANIGFYVYPGGSGPVKASLENVAIMGAGSGAVEISTGTTKITGSVLTQSLYGVYAFEGATVSVANSQITDNTTGVCSNASSKIRLDNNDIYDNPTAISNCGGIVKTSGSNKTSGTISIPAADISESVTF